MSETGGSTTCGSSTVGIVTIGSAGADEGNRYGITFIVMTVHKIVTMMILMVSNMLEDCTGSSKVPALTSGMLNMP